MNKRALTRRGLTQLALADIGGAHGALNKDSIAFDFLLKRGRGEKNVGTFETFHTSQKLFAGKCDDGLMWTYEHFTQNLQS